MLLHAARSLRSQVQCIASETSNCKELINIAQYTPFTRELIRRMLSTEPNTWSITHTTPHNTITAHHHASPVIAVRGGLAHQRREYSRRRNAEYRSVLKQSPRLIQRLICFFNARRRAFQCNRHAGRSPMFSPGRLTVHGTSGP